MAVIVLGIVLFLIGWLTNHDLLASLGLGCIVIGVVLYIIGAGAY